MRKMRIPASLLPVLSMCTYIRTCVVNVHGTISTRVYRSVYSGVYVRVWVSAYSPSCLHVRM